MRNAMAFFGRPRIYANYAIVIVVLALLLPLASVVASIVAFLGLLAAVSGVFIPLVLITAPFGYLIGQPAEASVGPWVINSPWEAVIAGPIGLSVLAAELVAANAAVNRFRDLKPIATARKKTSG